MQLPLLRTAVITARCVCGCVCVCVSVCVRLGQRECLCIYVEVRTHYDLVTMLQFFIDETFVPECETEMLPMKE